MLNDKLGTKQVLFKLAQAGVYCDRELLALTSDALNLVTRESAGNQHRRWWTIDQVEVLRAVLSLHRFGDMTVGQAVALVQAGRPIEEVVAPAIAALRSAADLVRRQAMDAVA